MKYNMSNHDCLKAFLTLLTIAAVPAGRAFAASVTGTVIDESAHPINKARVSIHLRAGAGMLVNSYSNSPTTRTTPSRAYNDYSLTDARGIFAFTNVPAGVIQVCVQTDDRTRLDPCVWDRNANYFEFRGDKDVNLPQVRAELGHLLSITITDPSMSLAARDFNQPRSALKEDVLVSLRSPVMGFIPVKPKQGAQGRVYEYLIPYDTPVPLNIYVPGLELKDSQTGKQTARLSQIVRINKSSPKDFQFQIVKGN